MTRRLKRWIVLSAVVCWIAVPAAAGDWPTYRHDNQRSGITAEQMDPPLSADWVFTPTHPPVHAWADPQPKRIEGNLELPRMRFDDAFHVAAAGGMIYFGSSGDNNVYALDAKTGQVRWQFATGGPVRLAPTVWKDRVLVGSDDGKVYCLAARDGRKLWEFAAAPADEQLLGNGKMISVWPVRTSVLVDGGVAYFGAGVFPADGQYLHAVDIRSGKAIWKNDIYAFGGRGAVTPQGYLLASSDKLFMPSGRSKPAAFSRANGKFLFQKPFSWRKDGLFGGTFCSLAGELLYNGTEQMIGMYARNGRLAFTEGALRWAVGKQAAYLLTGSELVAYERDPWIAAKKATPRLNGKILLLAGQLEHLRGVVKVYPKARTKIPDTEAALNKALAEQKRKAPTPLWRTPCDSTDAIVVAGRTIFVGGPNVVTAFDATSGRKLWSAPVKGKARGLAIADGRLIVSTDSGNIHCFVTGSKGRGLKTTQQVAADPFATDPRGTTYVKAAAEVVAGSGVQRGYALVLGGDARFAYELARRTELMIYVVQPDARKAADATEAFSKAGLLGARIVVRRGTLDSLPYSSYFANLIVCADSLLTGRTAAPAAEVLRMLKPCGGVAFVRKAPGADASSTSASDWVEDLKKALSDRGETGTTTNVAGNWVKITRGPLPGAGSWTHQYANAGNTAGGDDQHVRGPLGILWYGDPGPTRMPSRHASTAAPLALNGLMFVQGEDVIMAYDAYNGVLVWEREIPGATRLHLKTNVSNLAADRKSIFVVIGQECLRLDQATGKTLRTYRVPPTRSKYRDWQWLACVDGNLLGTRARDCIFAVDVETGQLKWQRKAGDICLTTVCAGDGKVFFVDRKVTEAHKAEALKGVPHKARLDRLGKPIPPDVRLVVALDVQTGRVAWQKPKYVSDCVVQISRGAGDLTAMYANNVLLLCGQPWNGHFWKEFLSGQFSRRSLIALAGNNGGELWSGRIGYRSRPLIVGDTIFAEPWAHDLYSGTPKMRTHPVTGAEAKWQISRPGHHCGNIVGSPNALFFRSGTMAYYDLQSDYGTAHFGAQRPGCWINSIPANGLVMVPEASSGCVCPFSVQCTIVFAPRETNRSWGMFSAPGAAVPVKRLAINFGATGDRKGADGKLWLGYPRPRKDRLVLDFRLYAPMGADGEYYRNNTNFPNVAGTADPWLYATGAKGLSQCTISLKKGDKSKGLYTVRLHFADTESRRGGERVFHVSVQGKTVLRNFDIVAAAGGPAKAVVREIKAVTATDAMRLSLESVRGATLLCGVEVIAEE